MKWEKIAIVIILCYLIVAIPLHSINQHKIEECAVGCTKIEYNLVVSVSDLGEEIECKCYDSFTREIKYIIINKEK